MRYVAKKSFGYNGAQLDTGQVIELAGLRNDERLVKLGYLLEMPSKAETYTCQCGAEFAEAWQRTRHGDMRHPETWFEQEEAPVLAKKARKQSVLTV